MQINVGHLNENGVFDGNYSTFALAGRVRAMVRTLSLALRSDRPTRACHGQGRGRQAVGVSRHLMMLTGYRAPLQGTGDSALDTLWKKKAEQVGQQQ